MYTQRIIIAKITMIIVKTTMVNGSAGIYRRKFGDFAIAPISWFLYAIAPKNLYPKNSAIALTVFNCADFLKYNFYNFQTVKLHGFK